MTAPDPDSFEKLASFYLGRQYDLARGKTLDPVLLYDAKDLCTHAMCVGMTGSGKTGLCLSLLEEAGLDSIPAICVDPKGDLANLMLTFPDLSAEDFRPWLDQSDATRHGQTIDQYALSTAKRWKEGLASWGQSPDRIRRFQQSVNVKIYTPGSQIGLPLTVLKSLDSPPPGMIDNPEAVNELVTGTVSALLTLLGINADPLVSPEHILISTILLHQWRLGQKVGVANLIRLISSPPIDRIGVMDLDSFMPGSERTKLAMRLNNLLASPAFASWLEGEPLSIDRLLYAEDGKPQLSVISIAHLSDSERMFFVTILLQELVSWMRQQSGTSSLRSIFYMDEVAGYFPPVANPPSKAPMLTLLKQARAYGLGITLATQNPVDLDYKGLSNIGTWFLGRLQTERDKARVLEGLEGAAATNGQKFDRAEMEQTLAALGNRVFLMNNVHDDGPVTFQTRWAMSYLAGPMGQDQIRQLMHEHKLEIDNQTASVDSLPKSATGGFCEQPPVVPTNIEERFLVATKRPRLGTQLVYRPALLVHASMHFVRSSADLDQWIDTTRLLTCADSVPEDLWQSSIALSADVEIETRPAEGMLYSTLPDDLINGANYKSFLTKLKNYLYRHCFATLYKSPSLKGYAPAESTEQQAARFFAQLRREQRDLETEKLREKYRKKIDSLEKKLRTAEERIDREANQYESASRSTLLSAASSLFGAFMGGRKGGVMTVARGLNRTSQQKDDVRRAERARDLLKDDLRDLERELQEELEQMTVKTDPSDIPIESIEVPPRKSDLRIGEIYLAWTPWQIFENGNMMALYDGLDEGAPKGPAQ
ncbi:ATP-binding protein [Stieleria sp. JC731]|uniref:ATP-binding protein n=1 Tax=Pirellulaceae TaxID=2691357 RepID=UPI001E300DA5|nr:ATP-binding protein [Stieleria sp. JC731]MCC9601420.1 ATP-binding protein [Stieleria sp. JC731]